MSMNRARSVGLAKQKSSTQGQPWYSHCRVGIEIGPCHHPEDAKDVDELYMSRLTGKEAVENLLKAGAEYGVVYMRDQNYTYYDSRAGRKCPNLGERDLLRECVDEARRYSLPIVAYCSVQRDTSSWVAHPDWRMKDKDGNDIPERLCYNSGYVELIKEFLAEMMEYEIAGFHIDWVEFDLSGPHGCSHGCWCRHCRARVRQTHGMDMPEDVGWDLPPTAANLEAWDSMLQFRYDSVARFCQELLSFVKAKRPELSVDFNYIGYPPFSWERGHRPVQHTMIGDFATGESAPCAFGHSAPSQRSLFMAGCRPGGRIQGVTSRSVYSYAFAVRPVAELKWEVFTYLAHGAQCTIVDKCNYDGTFDSVAIERVGQAFGEARRRREYFGHRPVQEVGLYYSGRTRDWYGRQDPARYFAAFSGAHTALLQAHIPLGMIMDENVSLDRLREFPVVYVPRATILSEREVALFEEYVACGGNLLVTGLTGTCDRYGLRKGTCDLSALFGARLIQCVDYVENYVRLPGSLAEGDGRFLLADIPADWPFMTWGPIAVFEPTGARSLGELMTAHHPGPGLTSPGQVIGPAVLINSYGQGQAVCVPCSPDAAFASDYRMPEHRNLIRNLVRYLNPKPKVMVEAPANVEAVVTWDEEQSRLLVHLIAFNGPGTSLADNWEDSWGKHFRVLPPEMEEAARYAARITVQHPFQKAEVINPKTHMSRQGSVIELDIADIHEVLVIY